MEELRQKGADVLHQPAGMRKKLLEKSPLQIENGEVKNYSAAVINETKVNHQPQIEKIQQKEQQR
jgi:hypothetical protein